MKKIKYEKPTSLDAGQVAAIQGAICSHGNGASDGCRKVDRPGVDPANNRSSLPTRFTRDYNGNWRQTGTKLIHSELELPSRGSAAMLFTWSDCFLYRHNPSLNYFA